MLLPEGAVEKVQALVSFMAPFPTVPDSGYGLFFLGLRLILCRLGRSASEEDLKLVSFLTHVEKGLRRWPCRSGEGLVLGDCDMVCTPDVCSGHRRG